ncbi:hypothetical protein TNIN_361821 [Trichonephila inaurata madagascariensis]|uniref:Uncharacterized protein n=1 Tax=Trichonephila inaurata madagascariensis TaxID=2747483 RepID=A0A8X6MHY0_9ARAC|nr:hypothetical protein TNIN_361821 [Trichonephila inaurata madagascariensis]
MVERLQITMRTFDFNVSIEEGDLSAWAEWSSPWSCEPPETGRDTYFRCIGHFRRVQLFSQRKGVEGAADHKSFETPPTAAPMALLRQGGRTNKAVDSYCHPEGWWEGWTPATDAEGPQSKISAAVLWLGTNICIVCCSSAVGL